MASVNVGGASFVGEVTVDTGSNTSLLNDVDLEICQTDPATGMCTTALAASVPDVVIASGETPTFGIFVVGKGQNVTLDPATRRVFVKFVALSIPQLTSHDFPMYRRIIFLP